MPAELSFEHDIPAGPFTLKAKGTGTEGLYGPWAVAVTGETTFMGMKVSQRFDFSFTTAERGQAPVTGHAKVYFGSPDATTGPFLGMNVEADLLGDVWVKPPPAPGAPHRLVVTARADLLEGDARVGTDSETTKTFPIFGPGNSQTFEFEVPTGLRATLEIAPNMWDDLLPIVPKGSKATATGVSYQQEIVVHVYDADEPVAGVEVRLVSDRGDRDRIDPAVRTTTQRGEARFTVDSDRRGTPAVRAVARHKGQDVPCGPLTLQFTAAWYEDTFEITGYNLPLESELGGKPVRANGLDADYGDAFLYSGLGVVMQGTGRGKDGRLVKRAKGGRWNDDSTWVVDEAACSFTIVDRHVGSRMRVLEQGISIAVDPSRIPYDHWVEIVGPPGRTAGIGKRRADDTGGKIKKAHIDDYMGVGEKARKAWGGTFHAKVKYLGPKP